MKILTSILLILQLLITFPAEAQMYQCTGFNDSGSSLTVIIDLFTKVLNVNGNQYKIVSGGSGTSPSNTENFPIKDNLIVYYSLKMVNYQFYLMQYNTYTNQLISSASLTCRS